MNFSIYHSEGYMYWTDYISDTIYRANLTTGQDMEAIVDVHLPEPGKASYGIPSAWDIIIIVG